MKIQSWDVIAVDSQNEVNPCQGCVFSFEGRAQRNCPALIDTEGNKSKLCTAFGKTFHFKANLVNVRVIGRVGIDLDGNPSSVFEIVRIRPACKPQPESMLITAVPLIEYKRVLQITHK